MTYEEAIKTIKIAKAEVEWNYPMEYWEAFDIAIDCIAKHVPKKPKEENGNVKVFCPTCKASLSGHEYCGRCGQKINWNEVD